MNRSSILILSVAAVLGMAVHVRSQAPALSAKTPLQQIQDMKAVNKTTLEKQAALLIQLDELQKQAAQIKFLAKRG